ncbi:hypothetical protein ALCH109712_07455 [Alkalicoccus chagannorensis]
MGCAVERVRGYGAARSFAPPARTFRGSGRSFRRRRQSFNGKTRSFGRCAVTPLAPADVPHRGSVTQQEPAVIQHLRRWHLLLTYHLDVFQYSQKQPNLYLKVLPLPFRAGIRIKAQSAFWSERRAASLLAFRGKKEVFFLPVQRRKPPSSCMKTYTFLYFKKTPPCPSSGHGGA